MIEGSGAAHARWLTLRAKWVVVGGVGWRTIRKDEQRRRAHA